MTYPARLAGNAQSDGIETLHLCRPTLFAHMMESLKKGLSYEEANNQAEQVREQLKTAQSEVDRPFKQEDEYREKAAQLKEVNSLLNMDEKDNTVMDAEPDEGDELPAPKDRGMER